MGLHAQARVFNEVYKSLKVKKMFEISIKIAIICVTKVWVVLLVLINLCLVLQAVVWRGYHGRIYLNICHHYSTRIERK